MQPRNAWLHINIAHTSRGKSMHEQTFHAMGCTISLVVDGTQPEIAQQVAQAPAWFEEWEQQLSRFRPDSALMQLNATTGTPVVVGGVLYDVITLALDAARQSDGLVSPLVLHALTAAGYDRSFEQIAAQQHGQLSPKPSLRWRDIRIDRRTRTVTLPTGGQLDLGGIAKGWAAERTAQQLAALGPTLVAAGGDIVVSGPMADGSPWPIAIDSPFAPNATLGTALLWNGAIATSGRDYRRWLRDGKPQHHIIDPRSGQPAETDILTATIVAPDGPTAEMAAKATLIQGSRAGLAWLEQRPTLAGMLALADGRVLTSRRMDLYLHNDRMIV
jgi:thiamine biosynthesis lipoprotein